MLPAVLVESNPPPVRDGARPSDALSLRRWLRARPQPRYRYAYAALAIVLATAVCLPLFPVVDLVNLVMVYLLAAVIVATRLGKGPATLTTLGGVATFVYLFIPHYNSFVMADVEHLPTFAIMFVVSMIVATRTSQLRAEVEATEEREVRTLTLYELSRDLAAAEERAAIAGVVHKHAARAFQCSSSLLLPGADGWSRLGEPSLAAQGEEPALLQRAVLERQPVRVGQRVLVPLVVANQVVGVWSCDGCDERVLQVPADRQLLSAFAHNIAVALHRLLVGEQAQAAQQQIEQERLRNVMLSSVSHDLRTPLAAITGAITTLIDSGVRLDEPTRNGLMHSIREDADALERQVRDMLDLTRLESGSMQVRRDWYPVDEIVGGAMTRVETLLGARQVEIVVPTTERLVWVDAALVEQLLVNLLENAVRYTPPDQPLLVCGTVDEGCLRLAVADRGPGIPKELRERVFTKFFRGSDLHGNRGAGLGLAICRAIAQLHDGTIAVEDRQGGGACFVVELPCTGTAAASPPPMPVEGT